MSSPRIRRLQGDYERMKRRFANSTRICIESTDGLPPEKYIITYNIKGLYAEPDGTLKERNQHRLEVNLTLGYPRRQPHCKLLTPIFHPNITESSVCSGDFYAASEGLDDLVIRIGRMIAYQEFNVKSPLNGIAAKWAEKNDSRLPVDARELAPSESTPPPAATATKPPPIPRQQTIAISPEEVSGTPSTPPQALDGSLKVTRQDQVKAIRHQIDEVWRARDFDKVEHLLKAYAAVSGEESDDLRRVRAALDAERFLEESARTCESAAAKIRSKAFSTAVAELNSLPAFPEPPSAEYETRLAEARSRLDQTRETAADKWVISVRNDVWQLCQGDKARYARVKGALEELNKIPISDESRATIKEQITTEARRTRAACVEKQIEAAIAASRWEDVLELCAELEAVDPGSFAAGTHRATATHKLQEALAAEVTSAWQRRDQSTTESLLMQYSKRWERLPEKLKHVERCVDMENFLAKAESSRSAAQAKATKRDFAGAVASLDAIPKAPAPPEDSYTAKLCSVMGTVGKLRQEALDDWVTSIEGKVSETCHGSAKEFIRVESIIAETTKIPMGHREKKAFQGRLREQALQERCQSLDAKLRAAGAERDWQLVISLSDELEVLDPKSKAAPVHRKKADDGMRLDAGVLQAVDAFAAGHYVECSKLCDKVTKEHDAKDYQFEADGFKGTLPELKQAARKNEAEYLAAVDGIRKAKDSCDWQGVSRWAKAARKLKPKDSTVSTLLKESHWQRAQIRRRATFRAIRRAAAVLVLCTLAFFLYHYARLWYTYDTALKEADEATAFDAAQKVRWFYSPAARFISAHDERALLKSAQLSATGILGHRYDGNWSVAQKVFTEGQKAWEAREFDTAQEKWSEARAYCQRVVRAAVPLTISLSPLLRDAFVRLAGADNEQLAVQQGAELSLQAAPGHYQMDIEHPDCQPHHEEIFVPAGCDGKVHVRAELTPLPGKLFVQCEPPASVLRRDKVIGKTGQPLVLPAGSHVLEVAAQHYETAIRTVSIGPNGEECLDLELRPLPRKLLAKCEPVATVLLNGQPIGKTDDDTLTVPVGEHKLTLAADGYRSQSFNATVRPGRDVKIDTTLEIIPLPGKLVLSCTPRAQVYADGELVGTTGEPILLTEGGHKIQLVADGYLKTDLNVNIPLGRDVEWTGSLTRIPGALHITATVPAEYGKPKHAPTATLTVDGKAKKVTLPYSDRTLPPGNHKIGIAVDGYEQGPDETVTIDSGEWTRMPITIVPLPATVTCVPDPADAKIRIYTTKVDVDAWNVKKGRKLGEGGEKLELMPFVDHTLTVEAKGYETTYKSFSLPYPGRDHGEITVKLEKTSRRR